MKLIYDKLFQIGIVLVLVSLLGLSLNFNRKLTQSNETRVISKTDTLLIRDTVLIEKPIYSSIRVIDTLTLTSYIKQPSDTIYKIDTIYIKVPREQKHYHSHRYSAWISGISPELDSLKIYETTTQIINQTSVKTHQRTSKWGIGIQVGYGVILSSKIETHPYIGIGVSYNLLSF